MAKGASLLPDDWGSSGRVPDGKYTITKSIAGTFTYPGKNITSPAALVTFTAADGTEYTQPYSAGKLENLVPDDDGKKFVHPSGPKHDAKIERTSNLALFTQSMLNSGFPLESLSDEMSVFEGTEVQLENQVINRPGLESSGKPLPLVTKVLSLKGKQSKRPSVPVKAEKVHSAAPVVPAATTASNGDLNTLTRDAVMLILSERGGSIKIPVLSTAIFQKGVKAQNPNVMEMRQLAQDAEWLAANAEAGGWVVEGDTVHV